MPSVVGEKGRVETPSDMVSRGGVGVLYRVVCRCVNVSVIATIIYLQLHSSYIIILK